MKISILSALLTLTIIGSAIANPMDKQRPIDKLIVALNIDEERSAYLREALAQGHEEMHQLHQEMREQMKAIRASQRELAAQILSAEELEMLEEIIRDKPHGPPPHHRAAQDNKISANF